MKINKNNQYYSWSRSEMVNFVPKTSRKILEVGCGQGLFVSQFKDENSVIWGVEMNIDMAKIAEEKIDKVLVGEIDKNMDIIPNSYFDCIVFNDVLEHLVDPWETLEKIKEKLSPGGVVVCSIPNIRNVRALKILLLDKQWKYEDAGIFDRTHLRFFTKKSIIEMFNDCGYEIIRIKGINSTKHLILLFFISIITLGIFSDSRYLQFACVAKPKGLNKINDRNF